MNIIDKPYKEVIKKQYTQVKQKYELLIFKRGSRQLKIKIQTEISSGRIRGTRRGRIRTKTRTRTRTRTRTPKLISVVK